MKNNMDNVFKEWRKIYQDHWDTCKEPVCHICCRSGKEIESIEIKPEILEENKDAKKN